MLNEILFIVGITSIPDHRMASPFLPDHYTSTFKYFLPVCVRTLQAEQIKNTKTILRAYMCDIDGVYRRLSTAKNYSKNSHA